VTAQDVVADILLAIAVVMVAISSLGILFMRDVFEKLHYVTPAALVAPLFVALAVTVEAGWSAGTTDSWLALLFVAVTGPVLAHATARAARTRQSGDWARPEGVTFQKPATRPPKGKI
jgi:monovalent cation/proton antiporter MnhG/PhaG subunit